MLISQEHVTTEMRISLTEDSEMLTHKSSGMLISLEKTHVDFISTADLKDTIKS